MNNCGNLAQRGRVKLHLAVKPKRQETFTQGRYEHLMPHLQIYFLHRTRSYKHMNEYYQIQN